MSVCDHLAARGLEARELGLPDPHLATCATCRTELSAYDFMAGLPRLAAAHRAPPGWQVGVWAAIDALERDRAEPARAPSWWQRWVDRMPSPRWILALAPVAAVVVLLAVRAAPTRPALGLDVDVRPARGEPHRAASATVGDDVVVHAPGADAVWIYQEGAGVVARCPAAPRSASEGCRRTARGVELSFRVPAAARYRFVAIRRPGPVEPTGDLDRDGLALHAAGAELQVRAVIVPW